MYKNAQSEVATKNNKNKKKNNSPPRIQQTFRIDYEFHPTHTFIAAFIRRQGVTRITDIAMVT